MTLIDLIYMLIAVGLNLGPAVMVYAAIYAPRPVAIDGLFADWDRSDSPGCALGIHRDGEVPDIRYYGMADVKEGLRIGPDSVFRVPASSRLFTATCVMLLDRDDVLALKDDLRKWMPELHDYGQEVMLWHMLTRTSGLRDYRELIALAGLDEEAATNEAILELLARQRGLNHVPGRRFEASASNDFLMSLVVRRATEGEGLPAVARELIFEPLGMGSSSLRSEGAAAVPDLVIGYSPEDGGGWSAATTRTGVAGEHDLMTTVADYLAWDQNFYDAKVGGVELVDALAHPAAEANRIGIRMLPGRGHRLGLMTGKYRGLETVSHGGVTAGFAMHAIRFPEQRTTIAVFANSSSVDTARLCKSVANVVLAGHLTAGTYGGRFGGSRSPRRYSSPRQADAYVGEYASDELGVRYRLEASDSTLFLEYPWGERVRLEELRKNTLLAPVDRTLRFTHRRVRARERVAERDPRPDEGPALITGFLLDAPRAKGIVFERVRD